MFSGPPFFLWQPAGRTPQDAAPPNLGQQNATPPTTLLVRLWRRQTGAQFAEYGIVIIIAVSAAAVGVATFGSEVSAFFTALFDDMTVSPNLIP